MNHPDTSCTKKVKHLVQHWNIATRRWRQIWHHQKWRL